MKMEVVCQNTGLVRNGLPENLYDTERVWHSGGSVEHLFD